jgi:hypothetical protein
MSNSDHLNMQGEDALSWDSDELNRIQNLHLRDFNSLEVSKRQHTASCGAQHWLLPHSLLQRQV